MDAVLSGTGHHLKTISRFTDGMLSIFYRISVEDSEIEYTHQLGYHGDVSSTNATRVDATHVVDHRPSSTSHSDGVSYRGRESTADTRVGSPDNSFHTWNDESHSLLSYEPRKASWPTCTYTVTVRRAHP